MSTSTLSCSDQEEEEEYALGCVHYEIGLGGKKTDESVAYRFNSCSNVYSVIMFSINAGRTVFFWENKGVEIMVANGQQMSQD